MGDHEGRRSLVPPMQPRYHAPLPPLFPADAPAVDVCVYGATSAGVAAAVQARREGLSVRLLNPARKVGGMSASGLGFTDFGNRDAIGGVAREFYRRVGARYGREEEWRFEPHVAESVFDAWLAEVGVVPEHGHYLTEARVENGRIVELRCDNGATARARVFIDASYEGDLLAAARVSHVIGREDNAEFGETLNGAQVHAKHQFDFAVDPYIRPGDPASGLLPGIEPGEPPVIGVGDHRVQAYNFRLCLTQDPEKRLPFARPDGYDRRDYELLARYLAGGWNQMFRKFDQIRGGKTDTNNHGAFSSDLVGGAHRWPAARPAERERIFQEHLRHVRGLWWFYSQDEAVPAEVRARVNQWGPAADEFVATGGWPHQLYVREARRMRSATVLTEHHCLSRQQVSDPVGLAAYTMDSHNCRRFVRDGRVWNEGDVQMRLPRPYGIGYGALVPRRGECTNLVVPVCVSATHIAYGSVRMEPVFMVLAQAAATAAALALAPTRAGGAALALQDVPHAALRAKLEADGQIISWDPARLNGEPNDSPLLAHA